MDLQELETYLKQACDELQAIGNESDIGAWHQQHLAKNGKLNAFKKAIGKIEPEHRKEYGQAVNQGAARLQQAFADHTNQLKLDALRERIAAEAVDVTLPARSRSIGGYHPSTLMLREITHIFASMGFVVYESTHVELDEMSFQLLNIPKDHPARDMQDTFFIDEDVVLRPHTSPGQIHAMREYAPEPVQVILPGLCYRFEDVTPRSEMQFHQVEVLLVGPMVRFNDLKGVLLRFARHLFGEDQEIRLRGSYFPFTEPSVEVDIKCTLCHGSGCRVCKQTGWVELLGAGLVHPVVLENGGYDPNTNRGIAFGIGIERMVMMKHQIEDIRHIFQNDLRFLQQFA